MIKDKYLQQLADKVQKFNRGRGLKFFVFGSCLKRDRFGDCDIGVLGEVNSHDLVRLKESFSDSTFPYFVDIIHLDKTSETFKNNVLNDKILWLTH